MLVRIHDATWNMCNMQHTTPKFEKYGIIQISPVVVLEKIKGSAHMVESDHQIRKRYQPHPPPQNSQADLENSHQTLSVDTILKVMVNDHYFQY